MATRDELIAAAKALYPFRARGPFEGQAAYWEAFVAHVRSRDYAAAHELRVGRRQAEWTAADVAEFSDALLRERDRGTSQALPPTRVDDLHVLGQMDPPFTDAVIMGWGEVCVDVLGEMRRAKPAASLPILLNLLHADGLLTLKTLDRVGRVAIMRALARELAVQAYVLVADVFIHDIDLHDNRASKRDALVGHIGARSGLRRMLVRPYVIDANAVTFEAPRDVDKQADPAHIDDPYAGIFAPPSADGTH